MVCSTCSKKYGFFFLTYFIINFFCFKDTCVIGK